LALADARTALAQPQGEASRLERAEFPPVVLDEDDQHIEPQPCPRCDNAEFYLDDVNRQRLEAERKLALVRDALRESIEKGETLPLIRAAMDIVDSPAQPAPPSWEQVANVLANIHDVPKEVWEELAKLYGVYEPCLNCGDSRLCPDCNPPTQPAQEPPAPRAVLKGDLGCLTDDCEKWDECQPGVPCIIGRTLGDFYEGARVEPQGGEKE
jgi:hypothetical protein